MAIAEVFAEFVVKTRFDDMDTSVIEQVKKLTLKQVMGTIVGSRSESTGRMLPYLKENLGKPECGVYGLGFKTDVAQAALMNGFLAHASEMEDDQFPGGGISDVTVWPTLLTAAEKLQLSGKDVISALYVGQEMQNRIAYWACFGTDDIGICNLPFIGVYGATASCAKAYGLNEEQTKASFGLAMVQGLGYIFEMGTDAHYWESATVCRAGVVNAILAKNGFTSKPVIEQCLNMLTGKSLQFDKAIEGLGRAPFYTNTTWIKKWGFCFGNHVFVDILSDLMKQNRLGEADIEEVSVHFNPNRKLVLDRPEPKNIEDSRFSIQHILAYLMINGECGMETCTEESLHDKRLAEVRKKVKVIFHDDQSMKLTAGDGRVDVKLKNGKLLTGEMDQPYGGPKCPLTLDQVVDIYRRYCKGFLSEDRIERTKEIILHMEEYPNLQELFDICTSGP